MPIYAYKCSSCQHQLDVLQKISDAPLTVCPACGAATLAKQLTAAGFQLKGSGWYATDFKNSAPKPDAPAAAPAKPAESAPPPSAAGAADGGKDPAPAKDAPSTPAGASGGGAAGS